MRAERFFDTNVLLYLYSQDEPDKRAKAEAWTQDGGWISTQVLAEMSNVLLRKFGLTHGDVDAVIAELCAAFSVAVVAPETVRAALRIAGETGYGFYDSQILATALTCGCTEVVSEDMHAGHCIDGRLTLRNPFA